MKNTLLTTTALVITTGAAFAESAVNVKVGGYFRQTVGVASVDTAGDVLGVDTQGTGDFDGLDIFTDAEIIFKPSLTLDNGIKIGAEIQLEAGSDDNTDRIDESFISITGDFGQVLIGSENSAGYKQTVAAPDVSPLYAQSSSLTGFVPYSSETAGAGLFRGTLGTTFIENTTANNDANRITYFSPRFGGLQLGVSYARDAGQGSAPVDNDAVLSDIFDIGLNYGGSFGGVDVNASARYGIADGVDDDPEIYGFGLSLGYAGFTIGGSFAEQNDAGLEDGSAYDVGIGYANGPMSYSLTYFSGKNVDDEGADNIAGNGDDGLNGDEELETIVLAAQYKFNANFAVAGFVAYTDFEEDNVSTGTEADSADGTVLGVSALFNF